MIAGKAFAGTGFPGFICKACGCVLSDYQNDTLGFTPPFAGKLKMGCGLFRRAMPRCIYNPSKRGLLRKRRSKRARRRRLFCDRCNLPKAKKTSEQSGLCSDVARFSGAACAPRPPHIPRAARRGSRKRPESAAQASRARLQARSRSRRGLLRKRRSKGARRRRLFCGRCNLSKAKKTSEQSGLCSDVARLAGFEPATYRFVAGHSIH